MKACRPDHEPSRSRRPWIEYDPLPDVTPVEILMATIGSFIAAMAIGALVFYGCSGGI